MRTILAIVMVTITHYIIVIFFWVQTTKITFNHDGIVVVASGD